MAKEIQIQSMIQSMIENGTYSTEDLIKIIDPSGKIFTANRFIDELNQLTSVLTTDRNGDNHFDITDLELIKNDPFAIKHLVSSIILIMHDSTAIKNKIKNNEQTQILVYKILLYICLVTIPANTGTVWTDTDMLKILALISSIYTIIISAKYIGNIAAKIVSILKNTVCVCCLGTTTDQTEEINELIEDSNKKLERDIMNNKDKIVMINQIDSLRKHIGQDNII